MNEVGSHPAIDKWGIKKYNLPEGSKVRVESDTISHGYCDTCAYEEEVMEVYVKKPGEREQHLDTLHYMDMATLLREILDSAMA